MPITADTIQILPSIRMNDTPEGGGGPASQPIADGAENAIFPDISELDRARGRVNMRQLFCAVRTPDTDTYLGANLIVSEPPADPNVSITLFATPGTYDIRAQAQQRMQAYLVPGALWHGFLYENHIRGQRSIQILQRPHTEAPQVGQTLVLSAGLDEDAQQVQFVRVVRVSSAHRTFSFTSGMSVVDFEGQLITAEISEPLDRDWPGSTATRMFTAAAGATKIRDVVVADAATWAGIVPLAQPAKRGDVSVHAASIFTQLVPSAAAEVPLTNLRAAAAATALMAVGTLWSHSFGYGSRFSRHAPLNLGAAILPGTLRIASQYAGNPISDDAQGGLVQDGALVGRVDYHSGAATMLTDAIVESLFVQMVRASGVSGPLHSDIIDVTLQNRSLNYSGYMSPAPMVGSAVVHYRSMGRWYSLSDTGAGTLRGASSALGAGQVSPTSGAWQVTLGALPDVGSAIIVQWAAASQVLPWQAHGQMQALLAQYPRSAHQKGQALPLIQRIDLSGLIAEGEDVAALTLFYTLAGYTEMSIELGAGKKAIVHSHLSAQYDASRRELLVCFFYQAPKMGSALRVQLTRASTDTVYEHTERRTPDHAGRIIVATGRANLGAGTVQVHWQTWADVSTLGTRYTQEQVRQMGVAAHFGREVFENLGAGTLVPSWHTARDDGQGKLINPDGQQVGTIDYATGVLTFTAPDGHVRIPVPKYRTQFTGRTGGFENTYNLGYSGLQYFTLPTTMARAAGIVRVTASQGADAQLKRLSVAAAPVFELLGSGEAAGLLPGSLTLRNESTNHTFFDDGLGRLVVLRSGNTGIAPHTVARIDYAAGRVHWTDWSSWSINDIDLRSAQLSAGQLLSAAFAFRTPSAPLRAQSLSLQWTDASGQLKTVRADATGTIAADGITGRVDHNTGVVRVAFGRWVAAAGHEAEPWYHTSRIRSEDGKIWRPEPIAAAALHFSATAYSHMPLSAELIGIDPVQLPSDGRVPIFRTGTLAVLGNEQRLVIDSPQSGQLIDVGRQKLSGVRIQNAQGQSIDCGFEVDYEAGRVTLGTCSDWAAAAPITIIHRIEDMAVVSDAQITGELTFTRPLTHDYPVQGSYVSSAIEAGDRFARVLPIFDQHSWDGLTFSDRPQGSPAQASYDAARCPIEVTNAGAVTQRWALQFTSPTEFRIVAEQLGVIGTGKTTEDCAPMNDAAGAPYFRIRAAGWGQGWTYGNTLFIHTVGALYPFWCVRTVMPGRHTGLRYTFGLLARGDVDRPAE